MNHLIQGGESAQRFELLLKLTKIESEQISAALFDYYVKGVRSGTAAITNDTKAGNVSRAMESLEERAAIVEAIKEIDWEKHLAKLAAAHERIAELEAFIQSPKLS
ncbi:hypothetical protein L5M28_07280 [Shewanella sp. SW32]|uniref:hypothetical protein n=1 Tax=unclassified Shewanella TaxID=196818 RepID=UPI0021D92582|nr:MULTISPECIES: hypothetical protein [unclassified Shewanella]MCU7962379.1 hypothetical protein [Shewanella sp. SW32]MCU7971288.1 hypothetical protein [Shewanella sp. SW29]